MKNFFLNRDPRLIIVHSIADQIVSDSDVLVDAARLVIPLAANQILAVKFTGFLIATAVADIKFAFDIPAGCVGRWVGGELRSAQNLLTAAIAVTTSAGTNAICIFNAIVVNGATAGDLQLQFAQNVAEVSNTTLFAGSNLVAHRV